MRSNMKVQPNADVSPYLPWNERFKIALESYAPYKGPCPALIPVLVQGLQKWAAHLPYASCDDQGCHLPVNVWGLGAERTEVYGFVDWLILNNQQGFSDSLRKKFEALYSTARTLDNLYPKTKAQDEATEERLVSMCRRQTEQLTHFLEQLQKVAFKYTKTAGSKPKHTSAMRIRSDPEYKRTKVAVRIEKLENALEEHILSAKAYALASVDAGNGPVLLPRPRKRHLAQQNNMTPSEVSRCFSDKKSKVLNMLWEITDNLEAILRFKGL
jgi:hypothetical protein